MERLNEELSRKNWQNHLINFLKQPIMPKEK